MQSSDQRWIVAQEGSRQSYAVPIAFSRLGHLRTFYVDVWCRWGRNLLRHGPAGARALATHYSPEIPSERVVSFNRWAVVDRVQSHLSRRRLSTVQQGEQYCRFGKCFASAVRDRLAVLELDPARDRFFGFNTNCLEALEHLRERGILTVVDQVDPAKVEEDMVAEESERWPGWDRTPGRMPQSYWDRLKAEWKTADLVLVNSAWSAKALVSQGLAEAKIIVVPLAIDLAHHHVQEPIASEGRLQVLWLGNIILRKGIQYLVEAARRLVDLPIDFRLAGPLGISDAAVRKFPPNLKLLGRLTRDQLTHAYRQAHVFVLPTISDGFAITQLEAMAHGLPVVTTPNCGEVVTDGVDGFIVPARDSGALADAFARLNDNRQLLRAMSANALAKILKYDLPSNARLIEGFTRERSL
ncbi:MAG: glycosyltransferase family 4 protein [Opitutaceae bacterium]|nr:glycosyltransferase family 4 protein [Verrucomicrobiales bacterium]